MFVKPKTISGTVIVGEGLAELDYGVPTANLDVRPEDMEFGVFAALVDYQGTTYHAAVCYGVKSPPKFEVHLFDFEGDLFGQTLTVKIVAKVSELVAWQSKERMRQKILHDLELVEAVLKKQE
ncbi:riboflavin kinase [Patescibacteria group bacterium]|nr:riboflavin kinase [Patescibacteria group bacterium]